MIRTTFSSEYQFVPMHNLIDSLWSTLTRNTGREILLRGKWEINVPRLLKYMLSHCGRVLEGAVKYLVLFFFFYEKYPTAN